MFSSRYQIIVKIVATMSPRRVSCGLELSHVPDLKVAIEASSEAGYDFTTVPIVNPRYPRTTSLTFVILIVNCEGLRESLRM